MNVPFWGSNVDQCELKLFGVNLASCSCPNAVPQLTLEYKRCPKFNSSANTILDILNMYRLDCYATAAFEVVITVVDISRTQVLQLFLCAHVLNMYYMYSSLYSTWILLKSIYAVFTHCVQCVADNIRIFFSYTISS